MGMVWAAHRPPFHSAAAGVIPPNKGQTNSERTGVWVSCRPLSTTPRRGTRGHRCATLSFVVVKNSGGETTYPSFPPAPPSLLLMKYPGNDDEQVVMVIPLLLPLLLPLLAAHRRTKETRWRVEFTPPRHLSACPTLLTSLLPFGGDVA